MRFNDITSAVNLAVALDCQRTGTRIAMPSYVMDLLGHHASVLTPQLGGPRGQSGKRPTRALRCAVSKPLRSRRWRSVDHFSHRPGHVAC